MKDPIFFRVQRILTDCKRFEVVLLLRFLLVLLCQAATLCSVVAQLSLLVWPPVQLLILFGTPYSKQSVSCPKDFLSSTNLKATTRKVGDPIIRLPFSRRDT
jgi:hypothetical protein